MINPSHGDSGSFDNWDVILIQQYLCCLVTCRKTQFSSWWANIFCCDRFSAKGHDM
jgi:hypothetical protein